MNSLILATHSAYKRELFQRLGLSFEAIDSGLEESPFKDQGLAPSELTQILAREKALALKTQRPGTTIIGADQVCHLDGEIFSKSGDKEKALLQLQKMRGKTHELVTSYAIIRDEEVMGHTNTTKLKMADLSDDELNNYLEYDQPFDCAGSYKIESGGIALFDEIQCSDFTAIIGLPLLQLSADLKKIGYQPWNN